jgi:hypothetical protein
LRGAPATSPITAINGSRSRLKPSSRRHANTDHFPNHIADFALELAEQVERHHGRLPVRRGGGLAVKLIWR